MKTAQRASWFTSPILALVFASAAGAGEHELLARQIISPSGVKAGLCVHLGVTDGKLTAALGADGKFLVHGLASDRTSLEEARQHIQSQGQYGRVSVEHHSFARLPYAENLVNLIVAEDLPALLSEGLSLQEVVRVLVPNGVACFKGTTREDLKAGLAAAGVGDAEVTAASRGWVKVVKPRPREMDDWPCYDHEADGNLVSQDLLVGPAESLRWRSGPSWGIHGASVVNGWVSAGGRVFGSSPKSVPRGCGPERCPNPMGFIALRPTAGWGFSMRGCPEAKNPRAVARSFRSLWGAGSRPGTLSGEEPGILPSRPPEVREQVSNSAHPHRPGCPQRPAPLRKAGGSLGDQGRNPNVFATADRLYTPLDARGPLVALNAVTGETVKTYTECGRPDQVILNGGILLMAASDRSWAVEAASGKVLWTTPVGGKPALRQ